MGCDSMEQGIEVTAKSGLVWIDVIRKNEAGERTVRIALEPRQAMALSDEISEAVAKALGI